MTRIGLTVSLLMILAGCGSVYRVKTNDPSKPTGIPFFSNAGACTQQTVYANQYYLVTLKVTEGTSLLLNDVTKLSDVGHGSGDFQNLIAELNKAQPEFNSIQTAWTLLKQRQPFNPYTQVNGEFILSNTSKPSTAVDYSHQYSLNQKRPLAGSVSADYKLSSDGTLGEVQGQIQDTTLSTILAALPLSDLIKSAAGIATKTGAAAAQPPTNVQFSLEQEERLMTRTYSLTTAYKTNCPPGPPLTSSTTAVGLIMADAGAKDIAAKTDASKSDSSIGITGTINLPKALLQPAKTDVSPSSPKPASGAAAGNSPNPNGGSTPGAEKKIAE